MGDEANRLVIDVNGPGTAYAGASFVGRPSRDVAAEGVRIVTRPSELGDIDLRAVPHEAGDRLVSRRYASRGYKAGMSADMTIGAFWEGRLVTTLGLRRDRGGLAADQSFPEDMAALRAAGVPLCEFTRLAGEPEGPSKQVLASLFHLAYLQAAHHWGVERLVIEVNPRHQGFYERMLGFRPHGPERLHRSAGAPAVLMSLCLVESHRLRARHGRVATGGASRSLFPFFFKAQEEDLLRQRLASVFGPSHDA